MIKENKWTTGVLCIGQTPDASLHSRPQGGSACSLVVGKNNFIYLIHTIKIEMER